MAINPEVQAFADAMNSFFARQDAAMSGLQGDIDSLNAQIAVAIANALSQESKDALTAIQASVSAASDRLDALDALTPPVVPPTPPSGARR